MRNFKEKNLLLLPFQHLPAALALCELAQLLLDVPLHEHSVDNVSVATHPVNPVCLILPQLYITKQAMLENRNPTT